MDKLISKKVIIIFFVGIGIFLFAYFINNSFNSNINRILFVLNSNHTKTIEGFISSESIFGGFVYSLLFLIIQAVIAPFKENYIIRALINLYGLELGKTLSLLGLTLGAIINFTTSRILFYPLFSAVAKKYLHSFPKEIKISKLETFFLIVIRLLPLNIQDYISYALGVTNVKLFKYICITFICMLIKVIFISG